MLCFFFHLYVCLQVVIRQDINTLRPKQNGRHFADGIFKCIFLNENVLILIKFSLKFVLNNPVNNIPALVQIMAWCWPGNRPLPDPIMLSSLAYICVTRPQWVYYIWDSLVLVLPFFFATCVISVLRQDVRWKWHYFHLNLKTVCHVKCYSSDWEFDWYPVSADVLWMTRGPF